MRTRALAFLFLACLAVQGQQTNSDAALLTKTRALYDAPFRRNLVSFDCAVQFDRKGHIVEALKTFPPAAAPAVALLQVTGHRVFVDRNSATVSSLPKAPDLTAVPHASDLEQAFEAMAPSALNAWLPFSTNVILPVGPTQSHFQALNPGYKIAMSGTNMAATLLLTQDLRLTSAVSDLPQPMRFATEFIDGPDGYLLKSVKTGDTSDTTTSREAEFTFAYQTVDGFQIPSLVTAKPPGPEVWRFALTDCKVVRGIILKVGPPAP